MSVIIPIDNIKDIELELNENTFVRNTNKANNEIYIVNYHNAPNTVKEIGRLRELTFSEAGGGTSEVGHPEEFCRGAAGAGSRCTVRHSSGCRF